MRAPASLFQDRLRLTRAGEFQQVFKNNFRRADACVTILVGKKSGLGPRLGFAIARKQVPKAVGRNRLKRLFRESFRKAQHRLPDRDLVIMVRREIQLVGTAQDSGRHGSTLEQHHQAMRKILTAPVIVLILAYRYLISPVLGNHCRYTPSCSQFAIRGIETHGVLKACGSL